MLNIPTDAALDEARKETSDAIKTAYTESERHLSEATADRVVKSLEQYFHMQDRLLDRLNAPPQKTH